MIRRSISFLRTYQLYLAWVISFLGMVGSLFMSEILQYEPCKLCWFERICMYPLVILLGMAAYKNDRGVIPSARVLSAIGGVISLFQYLEQKVPAWHELIRCTGGVPCSTQYINWLGFITIPFLAFVGFLAITVVLSLRGGDDRENVED